MVFKTETDSSAKGFLAIEAPCLQWIKDEKENSMRAPKSFNTVCDAKRNAEHGSLSSGLLSSDVLSNWSKLQLGMFVKIPFKTSLDVWGDKAKPKPGLLLIW